jgi:Bacterial Ig domain
MVLRSAIVASLVIVARPAGTAHAETASPYRWVVDQGAEGPRFLRQVVPPTMAEASGLAKSRTIYLNRHGATLTPGPNNSTSNTSSIVSRASQVSSWNASAADWAATVSCMKDIWSHFDVAITEIDPGSTPHIEALFTRSPAEVGITDNIGGVSPFTTNCSVIEHSIVFAFTDNLPRRPRVICEVMSQEIAHSYGMDHELLAADPMTYLNYSGERQFQDRDASCGESTARPCGISGATCRATQNSFRLLTARLGAADRDHQPPVVGITAPADRAMLSAGFAITATASDNVEIASVAFYVDGDLVAVRTQAPYQVTTDPDLEPGAHTIVIEATDRDGNTAVEQREITVEGEISPFGLGCSSSRQPPAALLALALIGLMRRSQRSRRSGSARRA